MTMMKHSLAYELLSYFDYYPELSHFVSILIYIGFFSSYFGWKYYQINLINNHPWFKSLAYGRCEA